jgi:hypothetical protein
MVYLHRLLQHFPFPPAPERITTYGGRKNCSNTTHIPRIISSIKKYFPALFIVLSPSSHRLGFGSRKFDGGGPAGVAFRGPVVENCAA